MLIFQLAALTFTAAVLCLTLKKDQPAFAFLVSVCAAAGVLATVLHQAQPVLDWLDTWGGYFQGAGLGCLVRAAGDTAQDCQNYLIAFVPVYSGIAAAGGQTAGALVYSGMFFAMAQFLAAVIGKLLLPVLEIYFCFAACACVWGSRAVEEAAALFSKCLHWLLKVCGAVFSFVLGLQSVLAGTADSAALRTGKSVLQGAVPVVGDAAAAALTGAAAAVQLLKGSLALAALLALGASFTPILLHCLLYSLAFSGAGIAALAGGQKQCGRLCRLYAEGAGLCGSVLVLYFFLVFLSTALLLLTGNGV